MLSGPSQINRYLPLGGGPPPHSTHVSDSCIRSRILTRTWCISSGPGTGPFALHMCRSVFYVLCVCLKNRHVAGAQTIHTLKPTTGRSASYAVRGRHANHTWVILGVIPNWAWFGVFLLYAAKQIIIFSSVHGHVLAKDIHTCFSCLSWHRSFRTF